VVAVPDLSPEAKERARRTIAVSQVIAAHADEIAQATETLPDGHVLVALVDAEYQFAGMHWVGENELIERIAELEGPNGSAMVFSRDIEPAHVHGRTAELASIAEQRIATIDRITARREQQSD
jgi:alkyl hydroperoxide reductase subunit AhpF